MFITRLCLSVCALVLALVLVAYLWACIASAQTTLFDENLKPDVESASRARHLPPLRGYSFAPTGL